MTAVDVPSPDDYLKRGLLAQHEGVTDKRQGLDKRLCRKRPLRMENEGELGKDKVVRARSEGSNATSVFSRTGRALAGRSSRNECDSHGVSEGGDRVRDRKRGGKAEEDNQVNNNENEEMESN